MSEEGRSSGSIACRCSDGVFRQVMDADVSTEVDEDPDGNCRLDLLTAVDGEDSLYRADLPQDPPSYAAVDGARREIYYRMRLRARVIKHLQECGPVIALEEAKIEQQRDALALQDAVRLLPFLN